MVLEDINRESRISKVVGYSIPNSGTRDRTNLCHAYFFVPNIVFPLVTFTGDA